MDRGRAIRVVLLVAALLLTAVVVTVVATRPDESDDLPPAAEGLLPWAPRGDLHTDAVLVADAAATWREGVLADGGSVPVPAGDPYVLWAGEIGAGRVVVLEGVSSNGTPLVAQVAEHGEPATFGLDAVERLPDVPPDVLAVTYDGNLDLPGLTPGEGASLVQLLEAPTADTDERGLWRQRGTSQGNELELLDMRDASMTDTFLHVGGSDDAPARIIVGSVGVRAGVLATVDVWPDTLVPTPSPVALADGPRWGPSGRIDGGEYVDAMAAVEAVGVSAATVREITAAVSTEGAQITARLMQVDADSGPYLALVARDETGDVACLSVTGPLPGPAASPGASPSTGSSASAESGGPEADDRLVAQQCIEPGRSLRVIAVAAAPGEGQVLLSGAAAGEGPVERLVEVGPYSSAQQEPRVASLVDDPAVQVTLPPLPPATG